MVIRRLALTRRKLLQTAGAAVAALSCPRELLTAPAAEPTTHGDTFAAPLSVQIHVDAAKSKGAVRPIWRFFGADEPNYATMKDGRKLLAKLGELRPQNVFFRAHNLLNTGDGTPSLKWGSTNAYTEDEQGNPIYDWTIIDSIFDTYLEHGVRPYVEIGFMPKALSSKPEPYQHNFPGTDFAVGFLAPPKDFKKWAELVFQWVRHCVQRYGKEEVEEWYWEVWNEPEGYWRDTTEEFYKLHDYAIDAVRRALPTARVGGPHSVDFETHSGRCVAGFATMKDFMRHVVHGTNYATGKKGTPTDFLAFHAKGSPTIVDGHVRMGIATQLRMIDVGFAVIASMPELRDKPIVIGESDPDGCAACVGPVNGYRNGTIYSSYTAASFARKHDLADKHRVNLDGALTWAFEFENHPYFAGHRVLSSNGLDLPVLNVFRMFAKMGGERIEAASSAEVPLDDILMHGVPAAPDVAAFASRHGQMVSIMVWHYHDDDIPGPAASVELTVAGLGTVSGQARLTHYRIDEHHSNSHAEWKRLGAPIAPNASVYSILEQSGKLATLGASQKVRIDQGNATLKFLLPRQAVSLLMLDLGQGGVNPSSP